MKRTLAFILLIFTVVLTLTACGNKLTYNLDGGAFDTAPDESATLADIVTKTPTKEGFVFAGWYSDKALTDYIQPGAVTEAQAQANCAYAKWITVPESTTFDVRKDTATITDSGRANQKMDTVALSQYYSIEDMMRAGYASLRVTVTLTLCEVDDGYQYVFLYKDTSCINTGSVTGWIDKNIFGNSDDPSLLYTHKYEHCPGAVGTDWATVTLEAVIPLEQLKKDLYLRYGASGNSDDTWYNKDVCVTVTPQR